MTVTALTLKPARHGGSEVAIVITELLLDIGFLACDDAAEHAASEHPKATLLGFPEMRPRSVSLNAAPIEPFASLPVG